MTAPAPRPKSVMRLRRRLAAGLGSRTVAWLLVAVATLALAAVVLDATVVLSEPLRVAAPWLLAGGAFVVAVLGIIRLRRLSDLGVARLMERHDPALGTSLTNAVQLAGRQGESAVEDLLCRQAVAYGDGRAGRLSVWPVVRRGTMAAVAAVVVAVALWVLGPVLFGDVFAAVLPRLLDPHGDHPPYSRVTIEVVPRDAEVMYGAQCEVRATVTGPHAGKLYLATENSRGQAQSVMFRAPDRSYFQALTNLREDVRYYVTDGRARSLRYRIHVVTAPLVNMVEVRAEYPFYTGLAPTVHKLKDEALQVPAGTVLTFRAGSNRPLSGGALEVTPVLGGDRRVVPLELEEQGAGIVAGLLRVREPVVFTLTVTDVDKVTCDQPVKGRVAVTPDRPPRIVVLEPSRRAVATPTISIPVHVRAEDDYRISDVLWFRGFNRSVERSVSMPLTRKGLSGNADAIGAFDLADLGVRPGDRIEYFFEAVDNSPDGPHVATSPLCSVEIISEEQYKALMQSMSAQEGLFDQYTQLENWLRRILEAAEMLRDEQQKLDAQGGGSAEDRQAQNRRAAELERSLSEYQKALGDTLNSTPQFDVEDAFRKTLADQQAALRDLQNRLERMTQKPASDQPLDSKELNRLADELRALAGKARQEIGEPVQLIAAVVQLLARADLFARLAQQQEELVRLARRFKDAKGELSRLEQMEIQELAAAQKRIGEALRTMMEELPELKSQLPQDAQYDKLRRSVEAFMRAVKDTAIQPDLDQAGERFAESDGPAGHRLAQSAAEKMLRLVKRVEQMDMEAEGQQCLQFQPALSQSLGNSLQQILSALRNKGMGGDGSSGYGLYGQDVSLYGPAVELSGSGRRMRGSPMVGEAAEGLGVARGDAADDVVPASAGPMRIRIQRDAKFPLRYRNIVGEYFRAVAESQNESGGADDK